ncbi:MAG: S8 family serine peptidase [Bacteriovoracaceae bacterium]|nr:S8 family serine peptidase [Bacteriovoracaceae bacterium]
MARTPLILICIIIIFQSCGGSGGSSGNGDPSGNSGFTISGPDRADYNVPNPLDPLANYQWHLDNKGLKFYTQVTNKQDEDINQSPVRNMAFSGHGVLVAVSDNGTEASHPDIYANIVPEYQRNYTSDNPGSWSQPASPTGTDGIAAHGTAVAGLIAGVDGNSEGIMGVAPRSKLAIFKYVGTGGNLNKAIDQANGPFDIFNYSYGRSSCMFIDLPQTLIDQFKYGVENLRDGKGAIYIKAGGNEYISGLDDCSDGAQGKYYGNSNLEEEHSYPWLVVVGAYNASGYSASYSTPGSSLWIVAPGGEFGIDYAAIITTDLTGCDQGMSHNQTSYTTFDEGSPENSNCNYTNSMNGSSAATPIVSGAVALILEANPNLTWRDVKYILAKSARKIDSLRNSTPHPQGANLQNHTYQDGWLTNSAGYHFHNWYGFGSVDATAAVQLAENYSTTLPTLQETEWVNQNLNINASIPDANSTGVSNTISVSSNLRIEAVQIKISIDHTYAGDLGVELTSPSGMKSILMNINSNILEQNLNDVLLLSNAFYGESSSGNWTLKVIDGAPADEGTLKSWKINFFGHSTNGSNLIAKSFDSNEIGLRKTKTETIINKTNSQKTIVDANKKNHPNTTNANSKDINTIIQQKSYSFKIISKDKIKEVSTEIKQVMDLNYKIGNDGLIRSLSQINDEKIIKTINSNEEDIKVESNAISLLDFQSHDNFYILTNNELKAQVFKYPVHGSLNNTTYIGNHYFYLNLDTNIGWKLNDKESKTFEIPEGYSSVFQIDNKTVLINNSCKNGLLNLKYPTKLEQYKCSRKLSGIKLVKHNGSLFIIGIEETSLSVNYLAVDNENRILSPVKISFPNYINKPILRDIKSVNDKLYLLIEGDNILEQIILEEDNEK